MWLSVGVQVRICSTSWATRLALQAALEKAQAIIDQVSKVKGRVKGHLS